MAKTVKPPRPVIYRHTRHADWGLGMIVEESASKFYVAFEDGRRRPFLNVQRYRDLLLPVEMEAEAAEETAAQITRGASKPAARAAERRPKKKAVAVDSEDEDVAEAEDRDEDEEGDE
jgi:trans-aconitate methyltransferase